MLKTKRACPVKLNNNNNNNNTSDIKIKCFIQINIFKNSCKMLMLEK